MRRMILGCVLLAAIGCDGRAKETPASAPTSTASTAPVAVPEVTVVYAGRDLDANGWPAESVWAKAPAYRYVVPATGGRAPAEGGEVRLAWDEKHLFLSAKLVDSAILARGREDQQKHFLLGDVAEFFVWPEGQKWYWEIYATPLGKKSCFTFPGISTQLHLADCRPIRVAVQIEGAVNDGRDRDRGWSAQLAVPWTVLTPPGGPAHGPWRFLAGRYNYPEEPPPPAGSNTAAGGPGNESSATQSSEKSAELELSAFPSLPAVDFHDRLNYARMKFLDCNGAEVQSPLAAEKGK